MISYEISSTPTVPTKQTRKRPHPGDVGYRDTVLRRAFENCHLNGLDFIKVKGTPNKGQILEVVTDPDKVQWERNRPLFLRVLVNDKEYMAHPSQLKRIRQK